MPESRFHGWVVAAAAACVLLVRLGATPLWDDDEPKNAACSLAMLDADDWVVPTFDGHLRIEKPPLVNWLHIAGIAVCGRNETGVRIGSALLTIGTCLLTWRLGTILLSPVVGLLGGLVMATSVWTAVGGRAATPDAPLVFLTTLTLLLFARAVVRNGAAGDPVRLSFREALAIGAACGAAVLAKGPIGVVVPATACASFAAIRAVTSPRPVLCGALTGLRPLVVTLALLAVACPWYAWVTIRTDGEWLRGFFLIHNIGRFAAPMEGHSGSAFSYYPAVIGIGLFPWSFVLAATLVHAAAMMRSADHRQRMPMHLLACWAGTWLAVLSLAGTKLPGYVWPAYPALAVATGCFLDAWQRGDIPWLRWQRSGRWMEAALMHVGLIVLLGGGVAIGVGLPLAARRWAPGAEWIGLFGLVPVLAAVIGWWAMAANRPRRVVAVVTVAGGLLSLSLAAFVAPRLGQEATPRALLGRGDRHDRTAEPLASFRHTPPSLVFYSRRPVCRLDTPEAVASQLAARPDTLLVVDTRMFGELAGVLPVSHGVVATVDTISARSLMLVGPLPPPPRLAASVDPPR